MIMDEILEGFHANFDLQGNGSGEKIFSTHAPHPRFSDYYKNNAMTLEKSQEKRRQSRLQDQKQKRFDALLAARQLAYEENDDQYNDSYKESDIDSRMDVEIFSDDKQKRKAVALGGHSRSHRRFYQDRLMLSEWLVDVPNDFALNFLMVVCPQGKRCLVVAAKGRTKAFSKAGYCILDFHSCLPGGSRSKESNSGFTLLDCIYNDVEQRFYALDLLSWNGTSCLDSDAEFRFFWLNAKFDENPNISKRTKKNPFEFYRLHYCRCTFEDMKKYIDELSPELLKHVDGFLFYHKEVHYSAGTTPLVGWLKPFMLTEILNLPIPEEFAQTNKLQQSAAEFRLDFDKQHQRDGKSSSTKDKQADSSINADDMDP